MRHTAKDFNDTMRCRREFWKVVYVISGHGWKIINDHKFPLSPGSLFVVHPDDNTTYLIESESIEIYNILFMPELIADGIRQLQSDFDFFAILGHDFLDLSPEHREMLYVLDSSREIEQLIRKMEKEYQREDSNYRNMIKLYLQALLICISRLSADKAGRNKKKSIGHYVEHIIDEHFREDINLATLAKKIGMTRSHLCRTFKQVNGKTIMARLLERRLTEAENMLRTPKYTITEICFGCGFNNLSYFYRAFTARYGVSPGSYRKTFTLD